MFNIKQFFSDIWLRVALVVGGLVAVLLYFLDLKNQKLAGLQAQVDNVTTAKQADVLETQIKANLANADLAQKDVDNHQAALTALDAKRTEVEAQTAKDTPTQAENYWNTPK